MKFWEALVMVLIITFSIFLFMVVISVMLVFNNNINQEIECDKMAEYGYHSMIKTENFGKTCWLLMEDGISIRAYDYSIADNRNALRLNNFGGEYGSS